MAVRERSNAGEVIFATALQAVVERLRETSGADIITVYPYDEETDTFYAPMAHGLPETDLVRALPDLSDQLRRFRDDQAQGKIPDDLQPSHYGPMAWLIATRRPLVSADAAREVDNSFVRRHRIHAIIGLPLLAGTHLIGLVFLNYLATPRGRKEIDVTSAEHMKRVEHAASDAASALDSARRAEESALLSALGEIVSVFSDAATDADGEGTAALRVESALHHVLATIRLDAAAFYAPVSAAHRLDLLASYGCPDLATKARSLPPAGADGITVDQTLVDALAAHDLHAVAALKPRGRERDGVLILADHDPAALQRRLPIGRTILQTAADLLGAVVDNSRLIEALGETNRTLGAVTRLSTRLLQPGATKEQALRTAASALTDPSLPELDFEFAALFLVGTASEGNLAVIESAGATASPAIDSLPDESDGPARGERRVPRWMWPTVRMLDPRDVVAYVSAHREIVVVAALDAGDDAFVTGYPEDRFERIEIDLLGADGTSNGRVRAARLREAADRAPLRGGADEGRSYRLTDEITLDAELFKSYGHASLVRVFVPFGVDDDAGRATGVLEAGYHISRKHRLERVQIEALRACAATVAVAVETAKLYEDVTRRAEQLEIVTEVSRTIVASIDLEQTLRLVARNMARAVDASVCLIALLDDGGSAWYGAAASDSEEMWRQRRVEQPERSIVFEVADRGRPMAIEDAQSHELISGHIARVLGIRSLLALPLLAGEGAPIGAVLLGQRDRKRVFNTEEVERAAGLAGQAAMAIRNARLHALEEEEHHIQKDVVLVGFGQWGQKAYQHLVLLKGFFNFRTHVVEMDRPGRRETLADAERAVLANGDLFYWDSPGNPARDALTLELEPSCYVVTYIATPAETHLPLLKSYYDLSNVVLIEKPLGAPPEDYRTFLDGTDGSVQVIAADHYWFKIEVRLLQLLLTEERNLRAFLDEIEEVEIEILEEQAPGGSGAQIGMIADLIPHAFAVLSLLTPLDRLTLAPHLPLQVGRYQPLRSEHETYARLVGSFDHRGRKVRVTIDVGKGVANAKWIKLSGERRMGGRRSFYKFDFTKGEAIDGTQSALRAAMRPIRQPGVPDNAHLSMLRHVIEKKHPAVGILSIREALRANARIQRLEQMAGEMIARGEWTAYEQGQRPTFQGADVLQLAEAREGSKEATREATRAGR